MNPFVHPEKGLVTAQGIRDSLGDFSQLLRYPSKYAARIAQAFTATDPSVSITRDQWEEMPDLGEEPYLYTDGVGTISPELGDMIWEALCAARPEGRRRGIKPSAVSMFRLYSAADIDIRSIVSNTFPRFVQVVCDQGRHQTDEWHHIRLQGHGGCG